jgi:YesN/AraC family two-component response regulator
MKKILVADDNRLERKIIQHILSEHFTNELQVETVPDGTVAIARMKDDKYDLVITDLLMPNIEGIELIRLIRENHPSVKIIAISGGNPFYLNYARILGVESIFTKPLNREFLIDSVGRILKMNMTTRINSSHTLSD